jgi:hypothetical protein
MRGAMLPLPPYAFMAWCSVKAQVQILSWELLLELSFDSILDEDDRGMYVILAFQNIICPRV